ncbi:MAG: hypothetical protein AAF495_26050 [Pseudomonadota bacterium]
MPAPRRFRGLRLTFIGLFVPFFLLLLAITFLIPLLMTEPFPIHDGTVSTTTYDLWFLAAAAVSFVAAILGAWWAALWIWRKRLALDEVKTHFAWSADARSGRLFHRVGKLSLPVMAWILSRVYGQVVRFEESAE